MMGSFSTACLKTKLHAECLGQTNNIIQVLGMMDFLVL